MENRARIPAFYLPVLVVLGLYGAAFFTFVMTSFHVAMPDGRVDRSVFGLQNYTKFFETPMVLSTLFDTFWISAMLTLVAMVLGYPFAYLLTRTHSSGLRRFMLGALMVTFLSGGITRAYAWMVLLGNNGLINKLLVTMGADRLPMLHNLTGVFIALVHFLLPFCVLTLVGTFQTLPRNMEEAATSLGAGRIRTFWTVVIPLTLRGGIGAAILTLSVAVSSFLFPLLLGGGRVRMMSNHIYDLIFVNFDIPYAAATAAVFLLATVAAISLMSMGLGLWSADRKWTAR